MHELVVQVTYQILGEPVLGLWCERCLTPARWGVPMSIEIDGTLYDLGVFSSCDRCDE